MKYRILIMCLLLTACGTDTAQKPPPALVTKGFADNQAFMLTEDMDYEVGQGEHTITIPKGFVTDYASVPKVLHSIGGRHGLYSRAALIHDFLYWSQICTRIEADNIMLLVMIASAVSTKAQVALYQGIRHGGAPAWNKNKEDREKGRLRVVPPEFFAFPAGINWPEYEQQLFDKGVKDPVFKNNPGYCSFGVSDDDYGTHVEQFLGTIPLEPTEPD